MTLGALTCKSTHLHPLYFTLSSEKTTAKIRQKWTPTLDHLSSLSFSSFLPPHLLITCPVKYYFLSQSVSSSLVHWQLLLAHSQEDPSANMTGKGKLATRTSEVTSLPAKFNLCSQVHLHPAASPFLWKFLLMLVSSLASGLFSFRPRASHLFSSLLLFLLVLFSGPLNGPIAPGHCLFASDFLVCPFAGPFSFFFHSPQHLSSNGS